MNKARQLRTLLASGERFIAADAYSALTGRIVERIGFKAAYLGGHACGSFHYCVPDNGTFSQIEQIEQASRIAAAIDIPLIVDADTLGETVADAFHFTRRYARAGIAGIHVEDEINPKHSTYDGGLTPIGDMQARLAASIKGRGDSELVLIARCDEMFIAAYRGGGAGSVDEAIKRGHAYAEAGADVLVYPGVSAEANVEIAKAVPIPVVAMGPSLPGSACTLSTGWGVTGAAQLHTDLARKLFETGELEFSPTFDGKAELIDQPLYDELTADWASKTGRTVRQV